MDVVVLSLSIKNTVAVAVNQERSIIYVSDDCRPSIADHRNHCHIKIPLLKQRLILVNIYLYFFLKNVRDI